MEHYYIKPDFFDWGVFKDHGTTILLVTLVLYLGALALSFRSSLAIRRRARRKARTTVVLMAILVSMAIAAGASIDTQLTSMHHQGTIHIPALIIISLGTVILFAWSRFLRFLRAARDREIWKKETTE